MKLCSEIRYVTHRVSLADAPCAFAPEDEAEWAIHAVRAVPGSSWRPPGHPERDEFVRRSRGEEIVICGHNGSEDSRASILALWDDYAAGMSPRSRDLDAVRSASAELTKIYSEALALPDEERAKESLLKIARVATELAEAVARMFGKRTAFPGIPIMSSRERPLSFKLDGAADRPCLVEVSFLESRKVPL